MSNQSPEWQAITKLVGQFYAKADAEPFREPVDWQALGLFDYPQLIKKPMDLGLVKKKLKENKYKSIHDAADDFRLIWKNCMAYNADGSDFYNLAQTMAKKFEEKFEKLCSQYDLGEYAGEGGHVDEPTIEEKRSFAKNLYKISKEELGKVITDLETKCPKALTKNVAEDEVEVNVDNISAVMFKEVVSYVNDCVAGGGSASSAKGKKVTTGTKRKSKSQ